MGFDSDRDFDRDVSRRRFIASSAAAAAALTIGPVFAQDTYPSHAITVINPFPPGGASDVVTRPLAATLETIVKQPVVIDIPRSRHNPKILGVDDAEIVGDRITEVRPIPWNLFTQKTERCIGELGASCVALVVRDVSVHEPP